MELETTGRINLKSVRLWLSIGGVIGLFMALYGWQIHDYANGFSKSELASVLASQSIGLDQLVNAPYLALQHIALTALGVNGFGIRLASVLVGLSSIALFYLLMRLLTNPRIAIFSSIMFGSASWMLHISRLGDATITTVLWPIAVLLIAFNVYKFNLEWYWYVVAGVVLGLASYTPRMAYFVMFAIIVAIVVFQRYDTKMHKLGALGGIASFAVVVAPLIISLVRNPSQITELFAIPDVAPTLLNLIESFGAGLRTLGWRSNAQGYLNLADLPLLDVITITFALLGLFVIFTDIRAPRGWLLLGMLFSSLLIITALPISATNVYFVLPTISIFSGIGLFTLWTRWREHFPKNNVARGVALFALGIVVLFSVGYNFERYYFAWSQVPETDRAFSESISEDAIIK